MLFQVGAMAHGKIDKEYTDDYIQSKWWSLETIKRFDAEK